MAPRPWSSLFGSRLPSARRQLAVVCGALKSTLPRGGECGFVGVDAGNEQHLHVSQHLLGERAAGRQLANQVEGCFGAVGFVAVLLGDDHHRRVIRFAQACQPDRPAFAAGVGLFEAEHSARATRHTGELRIQLGIAHEAFERDMLLLVEPRPIRLGGSGNHGGKACAKQEGGKRNTPCRRPDVPPALSGGLQFDLAQAQRLRLPRSC